MKRFQDSLIILTEGHADEMALHWLKKLKTSEKTPHHRSLPDEDILTTGLSFYKNMREIYFGEKHYSEVFSFFDTYAEDRYRKGIPLDEIVYSLIMMRRNIWIYANVKSNAFAYLDHNQLLEIINKTLLIFDRGIYIVTKKVEELQKESPGNLKE